VGNGLIATGVSKVIGAVTLLRPVDVTAGAGACVVLRGPNGAGKTTLLRVLAGLTEPTTGTVQLDGRPVDERDPAVRAALGVLLGAPATYRDLTLRDHLTLVDASWGRDPATCEQRVLAALGDFRLGALARRFPHELSSGQSQLFRLASVFFRPSRALLLDEPEQRLDVEGVEWLAQRLKAEREAGLAIIMASHEPRLVEVVSTRTIRVGA